MKFTLEEYEGCFSLNMQAETMAEAATLVRFGMNTTKELRSCSASAHKDGTFTAYVVVAKHRRACESVPKRK